MKDPFAHIPDMNNMGTVRKLASKIAKGGNPDEPGAGPPKKARVNTRKLGNDLAQRTIKDLTEKGWFANRADRTVQGAHGLFTEDFLGVADIVAFAIPRKHRECEVMFVQVTTEAGLADHERKLFKRTPIRQDKNQTYLGNLEKIYECGATFCIVTWAKNRSRRWVLTYHHYSLAQILVKAGDIESRRRKK